MPRCAPLGCALRCCLYSPSFPATSRGSCSLSEPVGVCCRWRQLKYRSPTYYDHLSRTSNGPTTSTQAATTTRASCGRSTNGFISISLGPRLNQHQITHFESRGGSAKTLGFSLPNGMPIFFFFFFFVGKGGNASCTIAPEHGCGGLHQGSPSWPEAFGRECPVSYPLKPPFAGFPAASLYVKLIWGPANGSNLVSLSSAHSFRSFFCFLTLLPSSMKRVAFQLFVTKSVSSPFSICVVSLGATSWS